MDSLWKCLLACILSLQSFGDTARTTNGSSKNFDEQNVRKLALKYQVELTGINMERILEDRLPDELSDNISDPKIVALPEYQNIRKVMRELGINSVRTIHGYTVYSFKNDNGTSVSLLLSSCGFYNHLKLPDSIHRIDKSWATIQTSERASIEQALSEIKPIEDLDPNQPGLESPVNW